MLQAFQFRVQNYRNIEDSGWIEIERVTAFVGRNESGKTALLKALHKFHPATPEPYDPQREFPRDRFTRDFRSGSDWPVCSVRFKIQGPVREKLAEFLEPGFVPNEVTCTRYYDQSLDTEFEPDLSAQVLSPKPLIEALGSLAGKARRLAAPSPEEEPAIQEHRERLTAWATSCADRLEGHTDLRREEGAALLSAIRSESDQQANPYTADVVEELQGVLDTILRSAKEEAHPIRARQIILESLPVFIYFENYGVLQSAIYLPRFLEDLERTPDDARVRTINAMFKHARLSAQDIAALGREQAHQIQAKGQKPTDEVIRQDQQRIEERAIKLNSASLDITKQFNEWYGQRRHDIRYRADGDYFRVWIADDRRPGVEIELEGRSKGFQWFFSFYLVFLVESEEGHKDAILLLDEPGLHLHPTAQQELIAFFEVLANSNQLIYTTHSPFLIDGEHLERVRPVTEDDTGHSRVTKDTWPEDRETIFPLQAAAGYAMIKSLFQHTKNVLVEGMSDYYYLHALSMQCRATGRTPLPEDIHVTPCGGTKLVGHLASLFLGQGVRPVIILDGDTAGRARRDALLRDLYASHQSSVLMLDSALEREDTETEIEDILDEATYLPAASTAIGHNVRLNDADRATGSLPSQVKAWAARRGVALPDGWKASAALHLVSDWAEHRTRLSDEILDRAASLFGALGHRFDVDTQ